MTCSYNFIYSKTSKSKRAEPQSIQFCDHLPVGQKQTSESKLILIRDWLTVKGNIPNLL